MSSGSGDGKAPDLPRGLIDRHGAPAGKGRLTSLRTPRDLTLGGVPKRMFVPNIPARRERSAPAENREQTNSKPRETSRERSERGRGRGRGRDGRGRGRGRAESNIVQTQSVFEQGPAVQRVRAPESGYFSGRGGWGGGGGGSSSSRSGGSGGRADGGGGGGGESMNTFKFDNPDGSDNTDDFLKYVMGTEYAAANLEDDEMAPSALPTPRSISVKREAERERERRNNYILPIKQEPEAVEDAEMPSVSNKDRQTEMPSVSGTQRQTEMPSTSDRHRETEMPGIFVRQRQTEDTDQLSSDFVRLNMQPAELLMETSRSQKEILALVQLPDTLPGNPPFVCETQPPSAAKSSKDNPQEKQAEVTTPRPTLRNFKEGWLGKMRVRQSGKVELVLGNHVLDVTAGVPVDCLQELVSIRTDIEEPRMTYLGQVTQKMVITPNFESILQAVASEKS